MAPRILLACLAVLALAGCGGEDEADDGTPGMPAPVTRLTVRLDPDGDGPQQARQARISCERQSGERGGPCATAVELRPADFEPAPDAVACTQQFGGPQTATIEGTLDRRSVHGRFSREDGCAISRWEKVAPLLEEAAG